MRERGLLAYPRGPILASQSGVGGAKHVGPRRIQAAALGSKAVAVAWVLASIACDPDDAALGLDAGMPEAAASDATPASDEDAAVHAPTLEPPAAPDPVVMTPCPAGWREVTAAESNGATCEPWPIDGRAACDEGETHFPGEPGCAPIGSACPAGDWPGDLPSDRLVTFVRAGAAPGGDGSRDRPIASLRAALATAPPGHTVAAAAGHYDEAIELPSGVELRGVCSRLTVIAPSIASAMAPAVLLRASGATLRDVSVTGPRPGVLAHGATDSSLRGVWIHDARGAGLVAAGAAQITLESVVVQRTSPLDEGGPGRGLEIGTMSRVEGRRLVVEHNAEASVVLAQGASAVLDRVALLDTLPDRDGTSGNGISVFGGGVLELSASVVERARTFAIVLNGSETRATLRDVVIRDVLPQDRDGAGGLALQIVRGARMDVSRLLVERARHFGFFVADPDSTLSGEHVAIRSVATAADETTTGWGIVAVGSASLRLGPLRVERAHDVAILVAGGAGAELSSLTVRDTLAGPADMGRALDVQSGGTATLSRARIERNREVALFVDGATLEASDLVVRDTESTTRSGTAGRGIEAQGGATVVLRRAALESNREVGVMLLGLATTLTASDLVVSGTRGQACASSACSGRGGGFGVAVLDDAYLTATSFGIVENELAGLVLAAGGTADMSVGAFSDHPIGVSVRTENFDVSRVMTSVVFEDNRRTFDTTEIPLPEPSPPPVEPE